jgi:hypothetical protein
MLDFPAFQQELIRQIKNFFRGFFRQRGILPGNIKITKKLRDQDIRIFNLFHKTMFAPFHFDPDKFIDKGISEMAVQLMDIGLNPPRIKRDYTGHKAAHDVEIPFHRTSIASRNL